MEVGKRITFLRTQKNYTTNKLANLAGVSQSYLRDVELGNKNPTVELLGLLCEALDLSLRDFFNDEALERIADDPLIAAVYRLNREQRELLTAFLRTL